MAYNRVCRVKRGSTKFDIEATLYDDDGQLVDLSPDAGDWTVTIKVCDPTDATNANKLEGSAMVLRNQTTNTGECYYEMTANDALVPVLDYNLEIKAVEPSGRVHFWPVDDDFDFATLKVMASKIVG